MGEVAPSSFEAATSAALSVEFESSMVAIAAVTFALEALDIEFKSNGHKLDESLFVKALQAYSGLLRSSAAHSGLWTFR
jgi:hypothetical protein